MSFLLRLFQQLISEVSESRRCSLIVPLLVVSVHILSAAVYDRLLTLGKVMSGYNLLAQRLQELRLFDYRVNLAVVP